MSEDYFDNKRRDAELAKLAITDESAFELLYGFYISELYGYVFKRVQHRETAEDIISIAFTKVFVNLHKFKDGTGGFKAWLYKITTNTIIDHYRKQGKNKESPINDIEHLFENGDKTDFEIDQKLDRVRIDQVLTKLSRKDQEIIHLKYFGELTNQEIADHLGITLNNCGVKIYRALEKFKKAYSAL